MSEANNNLSMRYALWSLATGVAALVFGYLGMGIPQHYYQPLFSALTLVILYRHRKVVSAQEPVGWLLVASNFLVLCLFYKLLIGGGVSYPFDWLKVPEFTSGNVSPDAPWHQRLFPDINVEMKPVPRISDWSIDITKIQTMFLLATLAGAVFRFQPFASLTAIGLLLFSIPTFAAFNWDWVILFLVVAGTSIYLQVPFNKELQTRPPDDVTRLPDR